MISEIEETDVIILPEMFITGFSMKPEILKEKMDGLSVQWMKKTAARKDTSVVGSLIIEEDGKVFNRAVWVFPDGKIQFYDKHYISYAEINDYRKSFPFLNDRDKFQIL